MGRSKGPAVWRWGFIFGGCAGALGIIAAVAASTLVAGAALLLDAVFVLIVFALYFAAGIFAARQTGSVGAATLAGLVAGIFSAILREIAAIFLTLNRPLPALSTTGTGLDPSTTQSLIVVFAIIGAVLVLLLFAGLGAGVAALGGLVGRPRSSGAYPYPYPMMYPGTQPMAGMPGSQGFPPPGYPTYPTMQPGFTPPPGYPMPQGFGPPPGYTPGYAPGYPPAPGAWYPPAPGYPPPASQTEPLGERSPDGASQSVPNSATPQPESMPPSSPQPEQPIYPPPPQYPS